MKIKYFLLFGMILLSLTLLNAYYSNTFTNSISNENLTFTGNTNITRYINLSQGTFLTDAYLNLSGYSLNRTGSNNTISINGLTSYWRLEDTSINGLKPSYFSGGEIDFTVHQNISNITLDCIYGNCLKSNGLQGNNKLITTSHILGSINMTLSMWVKPEMPPISSGGYFIGNPSSDSITMNSTGAVFLSTQAGALENDTANIENNQWHNLVYWCNDTGKNIYIDNKIVIIDNHVCTIATGVDYLGYYGVGGEVGVNMTWDEIALYNKSLNSSELTSLYNNYSVVNIFTNNNSLSIGNNNIWNYSGEFNKSNNRTNNLADSINSYLGTCSYVAGYCSVPFIFHSDSAGIFQYSDINFTGYYNGFIENSISFTPNTYETSSESFILNATYSTNFFGSSSAVLIYNGTSYETTKTSTSTGALFSKTLTMSEPIGNKSFYFIVSLTNSTGTSYFNSSFNNQSVSPVYFGICNSTLNVSYLNLTFKDETTGDYINATADLATFYIGNGTTSKTYIFTNTTLNPSYAFCFSPPSISNLNTLLQYFQYSNTGYPQRQYYFSGLLSNTTTNKVLYLLASASGIYSTIVANNPSGSPISGVTIQVERQFSGVWTLISQGVTDSSGSATFWLNPNYDHRIIGSKTGYSSNTVTIRPTQSAYTLIMGYATGNATYTNLLEGITFTTNPKAGFLLGNTTYDFTFNLSASKCDLVRYKMEIQNETGSVLDSSEGTNACGGNLSISFNTDNYKTIYGAYYIDKGDGYYLIDPQKWYMLNVTAGDGSIFKAFRNLYNSGQPQNIEEDYGRTWWLFFIIFLAIASFSYFTGTELGNPGIMLTVIMFLIIALSYMGYFYIYLSPLTDPWINQYGIAFVSCLLSLGYMFRRWVD